MSRKIAVVLAFALVVLCTAAFADTLQSTTGGSGWVSGWNPPTGTGHADFPSNAGTNGYYWDNGSYDGTIGTMNVGYCLTGTGECAGQIASPPGNIPFWSGDGAGAADMSMFFQSTAPGVDASALKIEIAGNAGINVFGWFETNSTGSIVGALHTIFTGPDSNGAVAVFTPTTYYGLYFQGENGNTFYSVAGLGSDPNYQHFAVFDGGNGGFWIGMEDLPFSHPTDFDYNDMIVSITPVPEPTTLVMFGSGLLGLASALRRKLQK